MSAGHPKSLKRKYHHSQLAKFLPAQLFYAFSDNYIPHMHPFCATPSLHPVGSPISKREPDDKSISSNILSAPFTLRIARISFSSVILFLPLFLDKSTRHFPACSHNFPKAGEARFQGLSRVFRLLGKFPYLGESRRILMAVSSKTSSKTRFTTPRRVASPPQPCSRPYGRSTRASS